MDSKYTQLAEFKSMAPPDFVSRFPPNDHPKRKSNTADIQRYFCERWAWSSEVEKETYLKKDFEGWNLAITGDSDLDRTESATIWCSWLFLWDDEVEKMSSTQARQALERLTGIFSVERIPEDVTPLEAVAIDIRRRVLNVEDEALRNFGDYVLHKASEGFFTATCAKQERVKAIAKGFDEFIKYRFRDCAAWLAIGIIFWSRGVILPVDLEASDLFPLYYGASVQAFLANDLISYWVEAGVLRDMQHSAGEDHEFVIFNSVAVLMAEKGISLQDAYAEVIGKIHAVEDKYIEDLERLRLEYLRDGKDFSQIEEASAILMDVMGGNLAWSKVSERYNPS